MAPWPSCLVLVGDRRLSCLLVLGARSGLVVVGPRHHSWGSGGGRRPSSAGCCRRSRVSGGSSSYDGCCRRRRWSWWWSVEGMSATGVDQSTESTEKAQAPGSSSLITQNPCLMMVSHSPEFPGLVPHRTPHRQDTFSVVGHRWPQTSGASLPQLQSFYH